MANQSAASTSDARPSRHGHGPARSGEPALDESAGGPPARQSWAGRIWPFCQTRTMGKLNMRQRLVVVIGFGAGLYFVGSWITTRGRVVTGWSSYAPLSVNSPQLGEPWLHPWVQLVIWLALVSIWVLGSMVLLRPPRSSSAEGSSVPIQ